MNLNKYMINRIYYHIIKADCLIHIKNPEYTTELFLFRIFILYRVLL